MAALPQATAGASAAKPAGTVKCLTPMEIAQCRKDGQCFHCDEFFTNGHKQVGKQIFCIEVLEENDDQTPPADPADPTISIHTLVVIRPLSGKTMQLHVDINGTRLLALLDSGSTHNFIDLEVAAHAGLQFGSRSGLQVAVANGGHVLSSGCCRNVSFNIGVVDFYGLALGSYEMVLGVQWLESLGSML
jgi:hypothetical protein